MNGILSVIVRNHVRGQAQTAFSLKFVPVVKATNISRSRPPYMTR